MFGSELTLWDGVLAVGLALLLPIKGWFANKKFDRDLSDGKPGVRLTMYRETLVFLWGSAFLVLALWFYLGRNFEVLGLQLVQTLASGLGFAVVAVAAVFLLLQVRSVQSSKESAASVIDQLAGETGVAKILPRTELEYRHFKFLSLTAGITEEILYRGFLIWFFSALVPLWVAAALSLGAFMLGHLYQQSWNAVLRVGLIGLGLTLVYLLSGSLWPSIILHAAIDLSSGVTVWHARKTVERANAV